MYVVHSTPCFSSQLQILKLQFSPFTTLSVQTYLHFFLAYDTEYCGFSNLWVHELLPWKSHMYKWNNHDQQFIKKKKCMMVIKRNTIKSTYKNHKSVRRRTSKEGREGRIIGWIIGFSPSSPCRFHTVYSAIPCGLRIHWRFQIGDHTETDWKNMQEIARNIDILIFLPGLHFITKENPHWFDFLLIFKKHLTFGNYMCIVYCIVFSNAIFSLPGNITNQSCVLQTGGRQDFEMSKLFRYCS